MVNLIVFCMLISTASTGAVKYNNYNLYNNS